MEITPALQKSLPALGKFGLWIGVTALANHFGTNTELTKMLSAIGVSSLNIEGACDIVKGIASGKISDYYKEVRSTEGFGINHHLQIAMRNGIANGLIDLRKAFLKENSLLDEEYNQITLFFKSLIFHLSKNFQTEDQINEYILDRKSFFQELLKKVFRSTENINNNITKDQVLIPILSNQVSHNLINFLTDNIEVYLYRYINEEFKINDKAKTAYFIHLLEYSARIGQTNLDMLVIVTNTLTDISQKQEQHKDLLKQISHIHSLIHESQRKLHIDFQSYRKEFNKLRDQFVNKFDLENQQNGILPVGFSYVNENNENSGTKASFNYQHYLNSNNQEYISRDSFYLTLQKKSDTHFITEASIIEKLLSTKNGTTVDGCIITGKGGIGKTRLTLEIGKSILKKGWKVIYVEPKVNNIQILKPYLNTKYKYLLVFDYIEESQCFSSDIIEELTSKNNEIIIKLIANCRNTYKNSIKVPKGSTFLSLNLDDENVVENKYEHYVTHKILEGVSKDFYEKYSVFYNLKPSFAVFLKFLVEKSKRLENELINDIREEGDFKSWIQRRLLMTLGKKDLNEIKSEVFYLFSILPLESKRSKQLDKDGYADYIDKLMNDGWLDLTDNNELKVIHDTIADEILLLYLDNTLSVNKRRISNLLEFSVKYNSLSKFIRSIERIKGQNNIPNSTFFYEQLTDLINENPTAVSSIKNYIGVTSLLNEPDRLDLLANNINFFLEYIEKPIFAKSLSFTLNSFSKKQPTENHRENILKLFTKWYAANLLFIETPDIAVKIISTIIKFLGINEFTSKYVPIYLERYAYKRDASFVIQNWLDKGGNSLDIKKYIKVYLKNNIHEFESTYVLTSWLQNGNNLISVEGYIEQYLQLHSYSHDISTLLEKWLEFGGKITIVSPYIIKYLETFSEKFEASYIFPAWLKFGGDPAVIEAFTIRHLEIYCEGSDASFILQSWLKYNGDLKHIEPYIERHLRNHIERPEVRFILQGWLYRGGSLLFIEKYIQQYLQIHLDKLATSIVLQAWLNRGGKIETLENLIIKRLQSVGDEESVGRSWLQLWMKSVEDVNKIEIHVKQYLQNFGRKIEASFILALWLAVGGELMTILEPVKHYLELYCEKPDASFVIQPWLKRGGNTKVIESFMKRYLALFFNKIETNFLLQEWLTKGGNVTAIELYIMKFIEVHSSRPEAQNVLQSWIKKAPNLNLVENFLNQHSIIYDKIEIFKENTVQYIEGGKVINFSKETIGRYLELNNERESTKFVFLTWLKNGGDPAIIEKYVQSYLEIHGEKLEIFSLLQTWLIYKGSTVSIEQYIERFFRLYNEKHEVKFILQAWLDNGGNLVLLEEYVKKYLLLNKEKYDTGHLIKSWLINGGNPSAIEEMAKFYFSIYYDKKSTCYLFQNWLKCAGNPYTIKQPLQVYLEKYNSEISSSYLLIDWMLNSGDCEYIEKFLLIYLKINSNNSKTRYLLVTWLNCGGKPDVIKGDLLHFLQLYDDEIVGRQLLSSWLKNSGDPVLIEKYVLRYAEQYGKDIEASHVLKPWLKYSGRLSVIKPHVVNYLKEFGESVTSCFILKAWLNNGGELNVVKQYVLFYLENYPTNAEYDEVLSAWTKRLNH